MKDRLCFLFLINSVTEGWKYVKLASKASLALEMFPYLLFFLLCKHTAGVGFLSAATKGIQEAWVFLPSFGEEQPALLLSIKGRRI